MEIKIKGESRKRDTGKWFATVEWDEPNGQHRLFVSEDVDTEDEADALVHGGVQDVVRQLSEADPEMTITEELWNGVQVGNA